ncbi:MAG: type 1 glutamine amidotransferase domain-containing protein [Spirochaeta sp.]
MKIAMAIGPGFEDLEHWAVYMRMAELGAGIITVGAKLGETYTSKHGGLTATADLTAEELSADELDALLIPGGWAPDKMRRDTALLQLIRDMDAADKLLGFICHAGWVAASAGIMRGRKATGSLGIRDDMENAGAMWVDKPAFREGNIVWGRVVQDIPAYNRELVKALTM